MKVYLTSNPSTELGYELKIVADDGTETFQPIKGFAKDGSIHLDPSNPSGREWVTRAKIEKAGGILELIPREKRAQKSESSPKTSSKGWSQYLTEDELKVIQELKEKALKRMKADKIRSQIEALQAMLDEEDE